MRSSSEGPSLGGVESRLRLAGDGKIRETGTTQHIIDTPQNDYTKALIAAADPAARGGGTRAAVDARPVIEVKNVVAGYGPVDRTGRPATPVLKDISFSIPAGATLGVVGESGCGKSTRA